MKNRFLIAALMALGIYGGIAHASVPTTQPAATRWPTATSTGIPSGTQLATATSTKIAAGTYTDVAYKGQLTIKLAGGQVVNFHRCSFDANGAQWCIRCDGNLGDIELDSCEMQRPAQAFVWGQHFGVNASYCHDSAEDGFRPSAFATITNNFVTKLGESEGAHADGVQIIGGHDVDVEGNTFDQLHDQHCNRNLMAQNKGLDRVKWMHNYCTGSGYFAVQFYDSTDPTGIVISGNTFKRLAGTYVPKHVQAGVAWTGNVFDDGSSAN